jgi:hypothetical protein
MPWESPLRVATLGYGGYRSRRPGSRRNRRTRGSSRRAEARETDRIFFVFAGLFLLVIILLLAALALFTG